MRLPTSFLARARAGLLSALALGMALVAPAAAQGTGTVRGTVTREDGAPLAGVIVTLEGTALKTVTNTRGVYVIERAPAGQQTLTFRWLGYKPTQVTSNVAATGVTTADVRLEQLPIQLSELTVTGASKAPERSVEAPAAFSLVDPRTLQTTGITGQAPLALRAVPGVDIAQSGVNDFNVNARGFNSSLNRRVLVLQDGRDLAIAFLGSQEWNALAVPTDEYSRMELVRGPGSALFGANAFFGVLNITTPTAREVVGTKLTVGGGELSSLRADLRHAGVFGGGRWGYRLNGGYNESDTWSRSRTALDSMDLIREYTPVVDDPTAHPIRKGREVRAINGQTIQAGSLIALGDRDKVRNIYGSARLDYYADGGSVLSAEGGLARVQNEIFVTGIGRVQVNQAYRPYARFTWANPNYNVMAYWNGRNSLPPASVRNPSGGDCSNTGAKPYAQSSLASGALLCEKSDIFHVEGQTTQSFADGKGRTVFGASARNYRVDTKGSLMRPEDDDRSDYYYAGFAQLDYDLSDQVKGVVAARFDVGSLIDPQFSPKVALVYSPSEKHSFRFTVNRAFQVPNYSEFFLRVAAGAPANFDALEAGLRASALGPALAGVPNGTLFGGTATGSTATSSSVPVFARGNSKLVPETTLGLETGYRADVSDKAYVSLDLYFNRIRNFVTDLLPGVNPAFPYWTAPSAVPASVRPTLVSTVRTLLAANQTASRGLTRTENGNTAIVVSYTNAGRVSQYGAEAGAGVQLTRTLRADGTVTYFDYSVDEGQTALGDSLLANTPKWKGTVSATFADKGWSTGLVFRVVEGYPWAAGVFTGYIENAVNLDANIAWEINNNFRLFATGTNILDNERFEVYGGSVNGRRVLGGVTVRF